MKYIKTFENHRNENLDLIEEGWKEWLAAGLITLSSIGGVYKINQDKVENTRQGIELVSKTSNMFHKMSTKEKSDLILKLAEKHKEVDANAALNTAEMGYDDAGKLTTNPDAGSRSEQQKKIDDESYDDQLNTAIESIMKDHPGFFGITHTGKIMAL